MVRWWHFGGPVGERDVGKGSEQCSVVLLVESTVLRSLSSHASPQVPGDQGREG